MTPGQGIMVETKGKARNGEQVSHLVEEFAAPGVDGLPLGLHQQVQGLGKGRHHHHRHD